MFLPAFFRLATLSVAATLTVLGAHVFLRLTGEGGLTAVDFLRTALVAFSGFWLVWGSSAAILGVFRPVRIDTGKSGGGPQGMTAILVPVYNEDPIATFSRIAAMNRSLVDLGISHKFHFVILSDTQVMETAAQEVVWFNRLIEEPDAIGRIFYRRRERNIGRKAGNIEDFIARSGAAYDYALILDADSLMEGATIAAMARRMDGDEQLGLLQTVPHVIHARTLFGRSLQFASTYLSPTFARGAALMAGNEGPYWGHNAMVRMRAFAACCGLPVLSGKPPFGGHILSHDYVEAALLSRGGWKVNLDPSMTGSYEEGPENLIEYAKRDRRWCQGNLQHARLVDAPGLKIWSRFTFIQGIMAYMASPLWLLLLAASVIAALFPDMPTAMPGFVNINFSAWTLIVAVAVVLLLPKFAILSRGMFDGHNRRFGGTLRSLASVLGEIVVSTLLAPTLLLLQSRSVMQVLLGIDGGWPATTRGQNWVDLKTAFHASWWIVAIAILTLGGILILAPASAVWVAPAMVPAILAPFLISITSRPTSNAGTPLLFATDSELSRPSIVDAQRAIFAAWTGQGTQDAGLITVRTAQHVTA
ncbi:glucans biosynthesis glucosyltransferase MdoH [Devosia psychrophila]|jgi:membrane glycosyltransferase|uniref:Glucans biosynthesis glucosyltransferase H n=1 Tax=Devosia psychrophila TaxID=728005 RepID=A0A1I1QWT8_9HYPH|nr:glucans biosynthesis glucosyltransferase MdoH [Devosia psychrophila]SFD24348.1 membrane glycosyltransferase [Devosia psychrophila]